jgi:hypothetical protein
MAPPVIQRRAGAKVFKLRSGERLLGMLPADMASLVLETPIFAFVA